MTGGQGYLACPWFVVHQHLHLSLSAGSGTGGNRAAGGEGTLAERKHLIVTPPIQSQRKHVHSGGKTTLG